MLRTYRTYLVVFMLAACAAFLPHAAFAASPQVTSFAVTPTSINNDYAAAFSWQMMNASGGDIYFACPTGTTVKTTTGSPVSCNTRIDIGSGVNVTGSAAYIFTNISGATQNLIATLYPKDQNGTDYDAGGAQTTLSISTSAQPIASASISTTSPYSGATVTLSWTGMDITATNLQLQCSPSLSYFSTDGTTVLPCDAPAFSTDLPASGSTSFIVRNNSYNNVQVAARILVAVGNKTYDAIHAAVEYFTALARVDQPAPIASIYATSTTVASAATTTLLWSAQNALGANLQFACSPSLSFAYPQTIATTTTLVPLPCNMPAFPSALSASSSTSVIFTNTSDQPQQAVVTVLPLIAGGVYDAIHSAKLSLLVQYPGQLASSPVTQIVLPSTTQMTTSVSTPHTPITVPLDIGSRGASVTILQTFLALDPSIYPEGLITGYFGTLTHNAVGRFQEKYSLAKPGDIAYGFVGPKTRAVINALLKP